MTEKILFFFSALGVFNASIVAILMLFKPGGSWKNRLLGWLLLCLVVRVGVSCFNFFGQIPQEAIKAGLIANLLMGPLVFFSLMEERKRVMNELLIHVAFWLIVLVAAWFVLDFSDWDSKLRFVIHAALSAYLLTAGIAFRKKVFSFNFRNQDAVVVYWAVVVICVGFAISLFSSYVLGPLVFSVVFYLSAGYLFFAGKRSGKAGGKPLDITQSREISEKLEKLMREQKLYRDPELSLDSLAIRLSISKHLLSQTLNDYLKQSFHHYINDHRIREACFMLRENRHFSIEAIGHEVGFHSRSSFFSSFKRIMGMTPSKYRASI